MRFLRNTRLIITKLLFYDALPAPYAEMPSNGTQCN